jgi:hypothetical protein
MLTVKIESISDYEIHIEKTIKDLGFSPKKGVLFKALVMQAFNDGIKLTMNKLEVEIKER